jgi:hypothetical protein
MCQVSVPGLNDDRCLADDQAERVAREPREPMPG